jgi:hypothetical protein
MTVESSASEFKINTREVWKDLQELRKEVAADAANTRDMLARIDGKLDIYALGINTAATTIEDHESRIRQMEKTIWRSAGAAAIIGAGAGILTSFIK